MRIPALFARKSAEDAEDVRTYARREPCRCLRLLVYKRKGVHEKVSDLLLPVDALYSSEAQIRGDGGGVGG